MNYPPPFRSLISLSIFKLVKEELTGWRGSAEHPRFCRFHPSSNDPLENGMRNTIALTNSDIMNTSE
jgi:hypothetical protein